MNASDNQIAETTRKSMPSRRTVFSAGRALAGFGESDGYLVSSGTGDPRSKR